MAGAARAARGTRRDSHGRWLWRLVGLSVRQVRKLVSLSAWRRRCSSSVLVAKDREVAFSGGSRVAANQDDSTVGAPTVFPRKTAKVFVGTFLSPSVYRGSLLSE